MSKNWIEDLEERLLEDVDQTISGADRAVHGALRHWHWSHWHPISTAPCNRDLEVRVAENGATVTLPFPCLHSNDGRWINVDLGTHIEIEPVSWRVWQSANSPEPHHSPIKSNEKAALPHRDYSTGRQRQMREK